ncbi:MAG: bifunctional phosphopantothenoylcysteine decarboxylase/phosphopantothenate--cysteine ligase CoaBC, partial [Alphaproteobacteria bacterium]|nr:bifunctional phosphopantothenoylcysteine decarboxylase/phosphopantothenate--cysteine ligase CoaBC [Alphaproteobacteria bacterium]
MTQPNTLQNRALLLIISGGIAAYKCLDLIRRLRDEGARVRCVLTEGGSKFVTPMSVTALSGQEVALDMWGESGSRPLDHIRLSRESDLVVVAPATANLMAKMAQGLADDLASTVLLASDKPVMIAPAMNGAMWKNAATQANVATLRSRGIRFIGPATGAMACGEEGEGRMVESAEILEAVRAHFSAPGPLAGLRALVTSGPTFEPLDPVRFLGNRSSGKQGYAIATALARAGADVLLVTGPTALMEPVGVKTL